MTLENTVSIRLQTGLLQSSPSRRTYYCRFIRAGRVRTNSNTLSDIEITPHALQTAWSAGLFNSKAVFIDHAAIWEYPSLENLVGVTQASIWNEADQSIEGTIKLYSNAPGLSIASLLDELLTEDAPPDIGLSLVFYPVWETESPSPCDGEGRGGGRKIISITHIESIDLVFQPAADGRVLQALSAFHVSNTTSQGDSPMPEELIKEETEITEIEEKEITSSRSEVDPEYSEGSEKDAANHEVIDFVAPLQDPAEDWVNALAKTTSDSIISASKLPNASKDRLKSQHYNSPEELNTAINSERAYLAQLHQDRVINLPGAPPRSPSISGMRTSLDQLTLALDALLAGIRPEGVQPLSGLRELYHLLSGDYEMTGLYHPDRVTFANVNSSTMAGLVANALNKRVVNEFQQYPMWWTPIVSIEDFSNLQTVRWITLGGIGELPTVSEGAAYTELTWDDVTETAAFVKKGGYLGITLESIDKDDTGRLRAAPRALAQAAWLTLSKALSSIFTANSGVGPTMSDSLALFHATHANLGSTALSVTSYTACRTAMRKQTELHSSERLGALTAPKFLLVPPDLEITALQVLASEYDYTYTLSDGQAAPANALAEGDTFNQRMQFARSRVIVIDLWTDTSDWAASADPRLYPTIGLAFRYGRTPEIFSVASPTAGLMFTNDTMPIKVRFFFATGPVDYRGLYKANVA
jgi:hypothetical protein